MTRQSKGKQETAGQLQASPEPQHVEVTAIEPHALQEMERASIDVQIATAKQYPRSLEQFKKRATDMVTLDEDTAASCIYRRPVGKDQSGKMTYAEGKSIRMAEIVAACYGNLRTASIISEMRPTYVKAIGFAHDLESNNAMRAETVESTIKRNGQPYDERMRVVVAKAAQSKAIRDAIFRVVPAALCASIEYAARQIIFGKKETLAHRRQRAIEWIKKLNIDTERIWSALGISGEAELGEEELVLLTGIKTSIQDGDVSIDEAFPPIEEQKAPEQTKGTNGLKARLHNKKAVKEDAPVEETPPATEPAPEQPQEPELKYECLHCGEQYAEKPASCPKCHSTKFLS